MIHLDRTPKQQLEKIIEQQNKFEKQGKTHIVFITHDFLPYEEYLVDNYIKQMKERGYRFDIINNQENV